MQKSIPWSYHPYRPYFVREENEIYICANSNDALDRPLSSYNYKSLRLIHIDGVRYDTRYQIDCFDSLYMQNPIPSPSEEDVPHTNQAEEENG